MSSNNRQRRLLILGFLPVLVICVSAQYYQYQKQQQLLAKQILNNAVFGIQNEIQEKKRLLNTFANQNQPLLGSIISDVDNIHLLSELLVQVRDYFPDNFATSIADNKGNILLDDFDGQIGDVCRADLQEHVHNAKENLRIHPNPGSYHFDIVAPWAYNNNDYLLFASFKADRLANILKSQQILDHELIIIIKEMDNLIEITSSGDRSVLSAENNYRLNPALLDDVISEKSIPGSLWTILAIRNPDLHTNRLISYFMFYSLLYFFYIGVVIYITSRKH